jgi:hypothetical protein
VTDLRPRVPCVKEQQDASCLFLARSSDNLELSSIYFAVVSYGCVGLCVKRHLAYPQINTTVLSPLVKLTGENREKLTPREFKMLMSEVERGRIVAENARQPAAAQSNVLVNAAQHPVVGQFGILLSARLNSDE